MPRPANRDSCLGGAGAVRMKVAQHCVHVAACAAQTDLGMQNNSDPGTQRSSASLPAVDALGYDLGRYQQVRGRGVAAEAACLSKTLALHMARCPLRGLTSLPCVRQPHKRAPALRADGRARPGHIWRGGPSSGPGHEPGLPCGGGDKAAAARRSAEELQNVCGTRDTAPVVLGASVHRVHQGGAHCCPLRLSQNRAPLGAWAPRCRRGR